MFNSKPKYKIISNIEIHHALECLKEFNLETTIKFLQQNPSYTNNSVIAKSVLAKTPSLLFVFSDNIKNNYQIIENILKIKDKGDCLSMASQELQKDFKLIKLAVTNTPEYYFKLTNKFKLNKELGEIVLVNDETFKNSLSRMPSKYFETHREITNNILKNNGEMLEYFSTKIKDDPEFVEMAVRQNAAALNSASSRIKDNEAIVRIACENYKLIWNSMSVRLQKNRDIQKLALTRNGYHLMKMGSNVQNDRELVTIALKGSGKTLEYASKKLKEDIQIAQIAIEQNSQALEYVSSKIVFDKNILTSLFHKNMWSATAHIFSTGTTVEEKEKRFNVLKNNLIDKPQEFFLESFKNIYNECYAKKESQYIEFPRVFDLFFHLATQETLEKINDEIGSLWMKNVVMKNISKKIILNTTLTTKPFKKDRKLGF